MIMNRTGGGGGGGGGGLQCLQRLRFCLFISMHKSTHHLNKQRITGLFEDKSTNYSLKKTIMSISFSSLKLLWLFIGRFDNVQISYIPLSSARNWMQYFYFSTFSHNTGCIYLQHTLTPLLCMVVYSDFYALCICTNIACNSLLLSTLHVRHQINVVLSR